MIRDTALYYLRNHPREAARALEATPREPLAAFIDRLVEEDQALVIGNLLPQTAAAYLATLDVKRAAKIMARLRSVSGAAILGMLRTNQRRPILDALPLEKGSKIRHLLRYPEDSVGSLMLITTLACRVDANVRRAKQLVRRFAQVDLPIMVVVDDDMKPVGLISVTTLLRIREKEPVAEHMRFIPMRLRAHADVQTVLTSPIWETEDHVPVVESDGRYVGLLAKSSLHGHALAAKTSATSPTQLMTTVLDIADMIWTPAAQTVARLATREPGPFDSEGSR